MVDVRIGDVDIGNWQSFLDRWSAQWIAAQDLLDPEEYDEEDVAAGLGFPPAGDRGTAALEERLGTRLPPSYRAFLQASNGWRYTGTAVYLLGVAEDVHWHRDPLGLTPLYEENLDERSGQDEILRAGMWKRSLQLSLDSDMTDVLLDPGDVGEDGEWPVYVYKGWSGEYPDRYDSFADYMEAMYREFHQGYSDRPEFDNEVTRELDASVERARLACLAGGDVDELLAVLDRARSFGRERARRLRDQMAAMLGPAGYLADTVDLDDPLYVREILPVVVAAEARPGGSTDEEWFLRRYEERDRPRVKAALRDAKERTFRYEAPGPFGRAVAEAREQARWGDTDAAWRTIAAGVAEWEPYGPEQVAPVGLMADPVLGPVITPERGRRLLRTARGGAERRRTGPLPDVPAAGSWVVPAPVPVLDAVSVVEDAPVPVEDPEAVLFPEPGLGWLGGERGEHSYRLVFAHGVTPEALAERLGAEGPLLAPCSEQDMWGLRHWGRGRGGAVFRVGSCAGGWSFAFERGPETFQPSRLSGLDAEVSRGTRAISIWSERHQAAGEAFPDAFRFSYAEDGRERFGSTVRGGGAESTGTPPEGLDPALFGAALVDGSGPRLDRDGETRALDAVAGAFGVALPQFAVCHGRLHAARGTSWIRPPGPGERYLTFSRIRGGAEG
ncbi:SMI1/KNR4 family protein [Streptomyces sp. NBC_00654]|uniref:SMI1/KNR4 family protein n=1 Tax=Streptomyces sp. NBC_00654 TaxID=2975799 RepID=UPI00224F5335|nr:SMI1/KNR4 family protein [Streptomyces sp. NBC_00654]MCX4963237.1 SMI1/KNR4 family protein [Streptomyces sp. NBC_00654]